jgi:hypothetical protein
LKLLTPLAETPIGRAIIAYFADLPRWTVANIGFAIALAPAFLAFYLDDFLLAILLSFPAFFALSGQCYAFAQTVEGRAPRWRDLFRLNVPLTLSLWAALALPLIALPFNPPPIFFAALCILIVFVLLVAPFVLCLPHLLPIGIGLVWRNALVLAIHFPMVALGLLVLIAIIAAIIVAAKGALIIALPALWVSIAIFSTHQLIGDSSPSNSK